MSIFTGARGVNIPKKVRKSRVVYKDKFIELQNIGKQHVFRLGLRQIKRYIKKSLFLNTDLLGQQGPIKVADASSEKLATPQDQ